jgi:uncharacterized protein YxjI
MSQNKSYEIQGIDLSDDHYTVEQGLIRSSKFKAMDKAGNVVLRTKQKRFKLKEEFPFVDANDNAVFTVKADQIRDVAGNYTLTDDQTGEPVVILDNDYSFLQDTWTIRDAETEAKIATIESQGALYTILRNVVPYGNFIPHEFEIMDANGTHVGSIEGQWSLKDRYDITIDDASNVPKEAIIAAAMVIDAIQGN